MDLSVRLADKVYEGTTCRYCHQPLLLESMDGDARQVYAQIAHAGAKSLGLCPPLDEIAERLRWDLSRVKSAADRLKKRDLLQGLSGRPNDYRVKHYDYSTALERVEMRARAAERQVRMMEAETPVALQKEITAMRDQYRSKVAELQHYKDKLQEAREQLKAQAAEFRAKIEAKTG